MTDASAGDFDFVIVGAGSAGCLLAERLSANPANRVALLEAGGEYRGWRLRIPAALPLVVGGERYNWAFETVPQPALGDRRLYWPRGKVIGGSSSINAMCALVGPAADYDRWVEYGGSAWSWSALAPLVEKMAAIESGASENRLPIAVQRYRHPLSETFVHAAAEAGYATNMDLNAAQPEGVSFYSVYQKNGERFENARAFLDPARGRSNLAIFTQARALKIDLDDERRATAVIARHNVKTVRITARREIILSAGTIGSPHVLLLSGVGPPDLLRAFGIEVRHALPGVGRNLQDHVDVTVVRRASGGSFSGRPRDWGQMLGAARDWRREHTGIFASNMAEAGGFIRSERVLSRPDLQLHFLPAIQQNHGRKLTGSLRAAGCTLHVCLLYPQSRGYVGLASADPLADPLIDPRYLTGACDLGVLMLGTGLILDILRRPAFAPFDLRPFEPARDPENDAELEALVRARAETIYHPVGTCRFGTDDTAVVDSRLRVRGIQGLRVVDASVMPTLIGANINFATTLIAENSSRFILEAH